MAGKRRLRSNPKFSDFGDREWDEFFGRGVRQPLPYAPLGPVSEGTLRPEDLAEAFSTALRELLRAEPDAKQRAKYAVLIQETQQKLIQYESAEEDELDAELGDLADELADALGNFAPPYAYFGAHPGDGAAFGFWLADDWKRQARENVADGLTLMLSDLHHVPEAFTGEVIEVNERGNVTLYACTLGELREIWSIV